MLIFILYMAAISAMTLSFTDYVFNHDWDKHPFHTCASATICLISLVFVICQTCAYAL